MSKIDDLIELVNKTADNEDNIDEGAICYEGYGFVFRDFKDLSELFNPVKSGKLYNVGSTRDLLNKYEKGDKDFGYMFDLGDYDDLVLAASVKTLVPTLEFGGDELLFQVFILVKTPKNKIFPLEFYYGPGRLAIGGWRSDFDGKLFNSFELPFEELDDLAEKLEGALMKVDPSNFMGIYYCDAGAFSMGVKNYDPFIEEIEEKDDKLPISILYNRKSYLFREEITKIILDNTKPGDNTSKIKKQYGDYKRFIINTRCYKEIIDYTKIQNDRICFQVLGVVLMVSGAKMTEDLKEIILENSRWEDEKHLYKDKKLRALRKKYLTEFRENIKNYEEGKPVDLDIYSENFP